MCFTQAGSKQDAKTTAGKKFAPVADAAAPRFSLPARVVTVGRPKGSRLRSPLRKLRGRACGTTISALPRFIPHTEPADE